MLSIKSLHYLLLAGLVFAGGGVLAQGTNSNPQLENCWQKLVLTGGGPFTLLKDNNGKARFRITHTGNPTSFRYFHIWGKSSVSNNWLRLGQSGQGYQRNETISITPPGSVTPLPVPIWGVTAATNWETRTIELDLDEYSEFRLSLFSENEAYPGGPLVIQNILQDVVLNFVSIEDVISITPKAGNTCFEFNNFRFDANVNLPGFCGTFKTARIRLANPGGPNNLGIPNNFVSTELHPSDVFPPNIPAICDMPGIDPCAVTGNPPYPVPCNCIDFILDFEYEPCPGAASDCPNLFGSKIVTICCKCDNRTSNNQH